ncbi:MAG TPA: hypothetical protein VFU29_24440 [Chitinophagaceae bacterium]|nr:hypothetical protein [Chitinophagaceae bacterium]
MDSESRIKIGFTELAFEGTKEELFQFLQPAEKYIYNAVFRTAKKYPDFEEIEKIIFTKGTNKNWKFTSKNFQLNFIAHIPKAPFELWLTKSKKNEIDLLKQKKELIFSTKVSELSLPSLSINTELLKLKNEVAETNRMASSVLHAKKIESDEVLENIEKDLQKLDSQLHSFESQNSERNMSAVATAKAFSGSDANLTMQQPQTMSKTALFLKENIYSDKPLIGNLASYDASRYIPVGTGRNYGFLYFIIGMGLGVFICYVFPKIKTLQF